MDSPTPLLFKKGDGTPINGWEEWTRPKREVQWKSGRSAMELARAWFLDGTAQTPREIEDLLASHSSTRQTRFTEGFPEWVTALPERGEGRNHDLMLLGEQQGQPLVACIEAKADEPFGERIGELYRKARDRQQTEGTRVPERSIALLKMVFGSGANPTEKPWCDLRYQLLTGLAGTLLEAQKRKMSRGLFIVQGFQSGALDSDKVALNEGDYARLIEALFAVPPLDVQRSRLYGLKILVGNLNHPVEILVGKTTQTVFVEPPQNLDQK